MSLRDTGKFRTERLDIQERVCDVCDDVISIDEYHSTTHLKLWVNPEQRYPDDYEWIPRWDICSPECLFTLATSDKVKRDFDTC